jgi:hypothetical protein
MVESLCLPGSTDWERDGWNSFLVVRIGAIIGGENSESMLVDWKRSAAAVTRWRNRERGNRGDEAEMECGETGCGRETRKGVVGAM